MAAITKRTRRRRASWAGDSNWSSALSTHHACGPRALEASFQAKEKNEWLPGASDETNPAWWLVDHLTLEYSKTRFQPHIPLLDEASFSRFSSHLVLSSLLHLPSSLLFSLLSFSSSLLLCVVLRLVLQQRLLVHPISEKQIENLPWCPLPENLTMPDPFSPQGIPDIAFVELLEDRRGQLGFVAADWPDSRCLLADIGEYLVRSAVILSHLAKDLADGHHIKTYAIQTINDMKETTDFSDLDPLDYFDSKHSSLKELASQLEGMANDIQSRWKQSQKPPELSSRRQKRPAQGQISGATADPMDEVTNYSGDVIQTGTGAARHRIRNSDGRPESPPFDDAINDTIQDLLKSLVSRGKGDHFCPLGHRCRKGGVDGNGEIVNFERNSVFRSHLEKHQKLYKCELPGCRNHKGFARKDQLQRHQENVAHNAM
ncbi:hypothetical protein BDBG_04955 [Blastomyces gilchristii SLH14081]|uniref:C2H2-type domain-containing protein n=1 Tax=Blastomyces gilchristii (strain SLH14081) TaxID=559298 RepID=A0A179UKW7_BLAGS|nr:uncharacterized protein BDBG_04955 [Blastomyces gilchristii SLH14081]OAT08716.1 hypothetical protein BDBG_04955 [Blastomyces gilchristii SLH14081]